VNELLTTMGIFIVYPWLAAFIGVLLVGLGSSGRRLIAIVVGVVSLLRSRRAPS
jgi:hypothetical protein